MRWNYTIVRGYNDTDKEGSRRWRVVDRDSGNYITSFDFKRDAINYILEQERQHTNQNETN